jgi:hypothetical protein
VLQSSGLVTAGGNAIGTKLAPWMVEAP